MLYTYTLYEGKALNNKDTLAICPLSSTFSDGNLYLQNVNRNFQQAIHFLYLHFYNNIRIIMIATTMASTPEPIANKNF